MNNNKYNFSDLIHFGLLLIAVLELALKFSG